jgi:hypothetical protein
LLAIETVVHDIGVLGVEETAVQIQIREGQLAAGPQGFLDHAGQSTPSRPCRRTVSSAYQHEASTLCMRKALAPMVLPAPTTVSPPTMVAPA